MPNVRFERLRFCLFCISQFLLLKGNLPRLMLWSVACTLRRQRAKPAGSFWPAGQSLSILRAQEPEGPDLLAVSGLLELVVCSCLYPSQCNNLCHRFWQMFRKASLGKDLHSFVKWTLNTCSGASLSKAIYARDKGEKVAQFTSQRTGNFPTSWHLVLLRPASWCPRSTDLPP